MKRSARTLLRALPAYMAGIAGKLGINLRIGGNRACTDGKTIWIPSLPIPTGDDILTPDQVAYLEKAKAMAIGFVLHEACHIKLTDFDVKGMAKKLGRDCTPVLHGFWNALEDIWIEHTMAKDWQGVPTIISEKIAVLNELRPFPDPESLPSAHVIQMHLHLRLRKQLLKNTAVDANAECYEREAEARFGDAFCRVVESISDEVVDAKSSSDVVGLAVRILAAIEEFEDEQDEQQDDQDGEDDQGDQQGDQDGDAGEDDQQGDQDGDADEDDQQGDQDGDADEDDQQGDQDGDAGEDDQQGDQNGDADQDGQQDDQDGDAGEDGQQGDQDGDAGEDDQQGDQHGSGGGGASSQRSNRQEVLDATEDQNMPHQDDQIREMLENLVKDADQHGCETAGGSQYLEVEQRPERCSTNRLGQVKGSARTVAGRVARFLNAQARSESRLDEKGRKVSGRHLAQAATSGRVFKKVSRTQLPNTLIEILLDRSGSMSSRMDVALDIATCIGAALETVPGVSVGLTAFPDIVPLVIPGEGVRRQADRIHLGACGGTPMGEAMWWVAGRAMMYPHDRKIMLVITDGAPNDPQVTLDARRGITAQGIEVLAIGIGADAMQLGQLFPVSAHANTIEVLAEAMVEILSPRLRNQAIAA